MYHQTPLIQIFCSSKATTHLLTNPYEMLMWAKNREVEKKKYQIRLLRVQSKIIHLITMYHFFLSYIRTICICTIQVCSASAENEQYVFYTLHLQRDWPEARAGSSSESLWYKSVRYQKISIRAVIGLQHWQRTTVMCAALCWLARCRRWQFQGLNPRHLRGASDWI